MNFATKRQEIEKGCEKYCKGRSWKCEECKAKLSILDECIAEREKEFEAIKEELLKCYHNPLDFQFLNKVIDKIKFKGVDKKEKEK